MQTLSGLGGAFLHPETPATPMRQAGLAARHPRRAWT